MDKTPANPLKQSITPHSTNSQAFSAWGGGAECCGETIEKTATRTMTTKNNTDTAFSFCSEFANPAAPKLGLEALGFDRQPSTLDVGLGCTAVGTRRNIRRTRPVFPRDTFLGPKPIKMIPDPARTAMIYRCFAKAKEPDPQNSQA